MGLMNKYWPTLAQQGYLRLASERAFSVFCLLAGTSGLGVTLINLPYITSYPVTVALGGIIALCCLAGPVFVVGAVRFERNVRIFGHTVAVMMLILSLAAEEMVSPSNLLFVPAVLTVTIAAGWRDGLVTLSLALCAFVGTFMMTGAQWAAALPAVNVSTLMATKSVGSSKGIGSIRSS